MNKKQLLLNLTSILKSTTKKMSKNEKKQKVSRLLLYSNIL